MADKKPTERLYIIREAGTHTPVALVKATSAPAALSKYVESKLYAGYASQDDILEAAGAGLKPFIAGEQAPATDAAE